MDDLKRPQRLFELDYRHVSHLCVFKSSHSGDNWFGHPSDSSLIYLGSHSSHNRHKDHFLDRRDEGCNNRLYRQHYWSTNCVEHFKSDHDRQGIHHWASSEFHKSDYDRKDLVHESHNNG